MHKSRSYYKANTRRLTRDGYIHTMFRAWRNKIIKYAHINFKAWVSLTCRYNKPSSSATLPGKGTRLTFSSCYTIQKKKDLEKFHQQTNPKENYILLLKDGKKGNSCTKLLLSAVSVYISSVRPTSPPPSHNGWKPGKYYMCLLTPRAESDVQSRIWTGNGKSTFSSWKEDKEA